MDGATEGGGLMGIALGLAEGAGELPEEGGRVLVGMYDTALGDTEGRVEGVRVGGGLMGILLGPEEGEEPPGVGEAVERTVGTTLGAVDEGTSEGSSEGASVGLVGNMDGSTVGVALI